MGRYSNNSFDTEVLLEILLPKWWWRDCSYYICMDVLYWCLDVRQWEDM